MDRKLFFIILSLLVVLFLSGLRHQHYVWPADHLKTYPGDIWYVFDHYVSRGYPFPVEYLSPMRVFVQLVNTVTTRKYPLYLWTTIYFLLPFAIGSTVILYLTLREKGLPPHRIYQYWILAPSFLVCALTNYDFVAVLTVVLGFYLAQKGKRIEAAVSLAVGAAFKVFPGYFLPLVLILCRDRKEILKVLGGFFGVWLAVNVPYMIGDPQGLKGWLYPYLWQSAHNFSRGPGDGSLWWPLYRVLGNGSISVLFTLSGIAWLAFQALRQGSREEDLWEWGRGIALVFLLFDRVYSPQYHLYLLPFLVMSRQRISLPVFYLLELPNVAVLVFLYFLRDHGLYNEPLMIMKYCALVILAVQFCRGMVVGVANLHSAEPISSQPSSK